MAGVKGRSGGARPNSGPKKRPPAVVAAPEPEKDAEGTQISADPLEFLTGVMQGRIEATAGQIKAATAMLNYVHTKKGEGGKKDAATEAAKTAAGGGAFSARPAPLKRVA